MNIKTMVVTAFCAVMISATAALMVRLLVLTAYDSESNLHSDVAVESESEMTMPEGRSLHSPAGVTHLPRAFRPVGSYQFQEQMQETTINVHAADLKQPHLLRIQPATAATQLSGQVKFNGKVIQTLKTSDTQINLSPYLKMGRHVVEISGQYQPSSGSVMVEFIGPGTESVQEMGGSGKLRQKLIIEVDAL